MSVLQVGSGSVIPADPPVMLCRLSASVCIRNKKAMVMITKAWPRARIATRPRIAARAAAASPPSGASTNGETSVCLERIPTV